MSDKPIWALSACEQAQRIASGDTSAAQVLEANLQRMDEVNPRLNAVVDDLSDDARAEAERLDNAFKKSGPVGPLHGVPVTIKVNVDQAGQATTNGVQAFAGLIAKEDAPLVANLKRAGAVVIGRTNTPEFSFRGSTDNPLYGRTFNPWNDWASAGGSSGGAGAAVVSGIGALAHGNDIAGSLRYPSTANGATTVKPGQGRVPAYNPSQTAERGLMAQLMSVQGLIAREVRDVRLGMEAMIGADPRDPWHVPLPFDQPFGPDHGKPKVAVTKNTFEYDLDPAVDAALDTARDSLLDAGYEVEEVDAPDIRDVARVALRTLFGEVKALMDSDIRRYGSDTINKVFDDYYELFPPYEGSELLKAMAKRTHFMREWTLFLQKYPLVLTPFMPFQTWEWDRDLKGIDGARDVLEGGIYSVSINFLGLPAGNIAANYNDGLPVGVQIIGQRFREDLVLDACEAIEQRVGVMAEKLVIKG